MGLMSSSNTTVAPTAKNGKNVLGPFTLKHFLSRKAGNLMIYSAETEWSCRIMGFRSAEQVEFSSQPDQNGSFELDKAQRDGTREFGTPVTAFQRKAPWSAWGDLNGTLLCWMMGYLSTSAATCPGALLAFNVSMQLPYPKTRRLLPLLQAINRL